MRVPEHDEVSSQAAPSLPSTEPFDAKAIKESVLRRLHAYWLSKQVDKRLPSRQDLDPSDMRELLPHILLVDTAETLGEFRYRLYGTELCRGFEQDRTNLRFAELPKIENFERAYEGYWRTYSQSVPVYFCGRTVSSSKDWLQYSRLTLPLSTDGTKVDKILGGLVFYSTSLGPRWPGLRGM